MALHANGGLSPPFAWLRDVSSKGHVRAAWSRSSIVTLPVKSDFASRGTATGVMMSTDA